ncbi:MAG: hypothetical protein EOM55_01270 [Clostridia bacterium]|nr:hypothetical protein [Clostridia bacterium]
MKKNKKEEFVEDLVEAVKLDFENRQKERKSYEAEWKLNSNFYGGNQYVGINAMNDLVKIPKEFFWQERQVFNHIEPIVESRLAKLTAIRPEMEVMPASNNESDIKTANISRDILKSVYEKLNLSSVISKATIWSEITGTSFYKITWNNFAGKKVFSKNDKTIFEGEVEVVPVSPFEIYPDSSSNENVDDCESIIHAKSYSTKMIKNIWKVDVQGSDINEMSLTDSAREDCVKHSQAVVIERYEAPNEECPNGRLVIVCGDNLLYLGELPFKNGVDGKRVFPFVKQVCCKRPGCFWGKSVIDKIIPVQRAYNALKNRKHEYLNRISMGVLTVEDGSVDTESLEQEGLQAGKILVYRQGSEPPKFLAEETLSGDFENEEKRLLSEFNEISGVNSILTSNISSQTISGTALELLIEQSTSRLSSSANEIEMAVKNLAKIILRLYKQFAVVPRILRLSNSEKELSFWKNSDLGQDDIQFLSDSATEESLASKRSNILKLLSSGVLHNNDGKLDDSVKLKIATLFGINL